MFIKMKPLIFILLALFLSGWIIAEEEQAMPPEIPKEFREKLTALFCMANDNFHTHGTSSEVSAALDDLIAVMDRYPEYADYRWAYPLLGYASRPAGNHLDRALGRPLHFEEYIDRLLTFKSDNWLKRQHNMSLLLYDVRIDFREKWSDEEFTNKRRQRVGQLLKCRRHILQLPADMAYQLRTDEVAPYIAELYGTLPQMTNELKELFEQYEIDTEFREQVLGLLDEQPLPYSVRHEVALAPLHRFPAFQERCDAFLKQLSEAVDDIKTRKIYEFDIDESVWIDSKHYEEFYKRSRPIELLFQSHEWNPHISSTEKLRSFYRGDLHDDADWPQFRRCVAEMWLAYIHAMADAFDPNYKRGDVTTFSGFFNTPELQAMVKAGKRESFFNYMENGIQSTLLRRNFFNAIDCGLRVLADIYRADADTQTELAELLEKYDFPYEMIFDGVEKSVSWWDTQPKSQEDWESPNLEQCVKLFVMIMLLDDFAHTNATETQKVAHQERLKRGQTVWKSILKQIDEPYRPTEEFQWPNGYAGPKDYAQIQDEELQRRFGEHRSRTAMNERWNHETRSLRGAEYNLGMYQNQTELELYKKQMAKIFEVLPN